MENISRDSSGRPVSRRGLRSGNESPIQLNPVRPGTNSSRSMAPLRTPSNNARIGTASRLTSASGIGPPPGTASRLASSMVAGMIPPRTGSSSQRIGTALGYAGSLMTERPITQHGLSGLPTSHGRIGTATGIRMVKDKRYWQAILQSKINEILQETSKLMNEKQTMDREQSAKRVFDRKVKESAKELTELQAQLTDMNIALDSFSSGLTRQNLQKEATALRERNETIQNQLEGLFGERQIKEEHNKQLEHEIEIEKNKINDMILSLPVEDQVKYREYQRLADSLKIQNSEMHNQIEGLSKQKERLNGIVMSSQMRLEAVRLQQKLRELTTKMETLRKEEENKLTPEQERDKLIKEVRANNQALTSIGHQMKIIEDQLNEKKDQLQLVEQDLQEGNSDKHAKYKELKRRDETMTIFLETFQEQISSERKNVELLKNQIAYAIEQITLQGINLKSYGLTNSDLLNEKNDRNTQTGLLKEYKRLGIQLKQLQILEKRTTTQLKQLMEEEAELLNEIRNYSNLDQLRSEAAENMEELTTKLEELRKKKHITEDVVAEAQKRNQEIKEHLRSNETYRQISHLEEKLVDLMRENKTLEEIVQQYRKENDYGKAQIEVESLVEIINTMLIEEHQKNKNMI